MARSCGWCIYYTKPPVEYLWPTSEPWTCWLDGENVAFGGRCDALQHWDPEEDRARAHWASVSAHEKAALVVTKVASYKED